MLNGIAQSYADPEFYLIDSLDLEQLNSGDRELLDTTLRRYHQADHDTLKVYELQNLIGGLWDADVLERYVDWAYNYALHKIKTSHSKEEIRYFYEVKADCFHQYAYLAGQMGNNPVKSLEYYQKSIELYKKYSDISLLATPYNNMGDLYIDLGNISKGLEYFNKALKIYEKVNDTDGIATAYNNLGYVYNHQGDDEKGLEYFQKSLEIRLDIDDKEGISISYNNIGYIYDIRGDSEKGLEYYNKSLNVSKELNDLDGMANTYNNIGSLLLDQGKPTEGLDYYQKGLDLFTQLNDKQGMAISSSLIGDLKLSQGDLVEARKFAERSLKYSNELGFPENIATSAKLLSDVAAKQGKFSEAYDMYRIHVKMRDSIYNDDNKNDALKQQARYEYQKQKALDDEKRLKEKAIAQADHEKKLAIEQEEKEKQQIVTGAAIGILILVVLFLVIVFNRLKVTKQQKSIIENQKIKVEQQKKEVEYAHAELEEKNKEITDSIKYAKRIQNAILPPTKLVKDYLEDSFIFYQPKDIVAGDFYWMEPTKEGVIFAAADCTGHGVPGAMVSVVCNNGLNRSVREFGLVDPADILDKTRDLVIQEFEKSEDEVKDGMDIALCNLKGNTLHYAGAHNPLWIIRKNELIEIKANKQPIGKFQAAEPFVGHQIELEPNDTFYVFSDGFADQFGGTNGKKFKTANFKKLLLSIQGEPMERQKELIHETFIKWKGSFEQLDDICVIGVRMS